LTFSEVGVSLRGRRMYLMLMSIKKKEEKKDILRMFKRCKEIVKKKLKGLFSF
jgi:hypothetical protein